MYSYVIIEFIEYAIVYVSCFPWIKWIRGRLTEKRRTSPSKKYMKKHDRELNVGLLIPALETLEVSRGGEACLRRSAPINSARLSRVDLWGAW